MTAIAKKIGEAPPYVFYLPVLSKLNRYMLSTLIS